MKDVKGLAVKLYCSRKWWFGESCIGSVLHMLLYIKYMELLLAVISVTAKLDTNVNSIHPSTRNTHPVSTSI